MNALKKVQCHVLKNKQSSHLLKKGKDRSFLENWQSISLVNVDAKIMSKVIATRIKNVLPNIIHHNQTGFIKDRSIGETAKENIPGLMMFIFSFLSALQDIFSPVLA